MKVIGSSDSRVRAGGFTLLEVMVALAVVSISLVVLLGTSNRSIGLSGELRNITQATLLAQEKMSELEVESATGRTTLGADEGEFEEPFDRFRWRTEYEETPLPSVVQITVTVLWGEEAKNESVDLISFLRD